MGRKKLPNRKHHQQCCSVDITNSKTKYILIMKFAFSREIHRSRVTLQHISERKPAKSLILLLIQELFQRSSFPRHAVYTCGFLPYEKKPTTCNKTPYINIFVIYYIQKFLQKNFNISAIKLKRVEKIQVAKQQVAKPVRVTNLQKICNIRKLNKMIH